MFTRTFYRVVLLIALAVLWIGVMYVLWVISVYYGPGEYMGSGILRPLIMSETFPRSEINTGRFIATAIISVLLTVFEIWCYQSALRLGESDRNSISE